MTVPGQHGSPVGFDQGHASPPLVSVIVPNYNHAAFLEERLASIRGQNMQDLELILLDDASTDGSMAVLEHMKACYPRTAHLVVNERNSGSPFKQWQKGIALAKGQWIWIAESDDRCAPDLLEQLLRFNTEHGGRLGVLYSQSRVIDAMGDVKGSMSDWTSDLTADPFRTDFTLPGKQFLSDYLKVKNVIPNASAVIFRKTLLKDPSIWADLGGLRLLGDWLFWTRLVQLTDVGFICASLNDFREHAGVTRRHIGAEKKKRRLLEEAVLRNELARNGAVDQRTEEAALYRKWADHVRFRALLGQDTDQCRIHPRSRPSFIAMILHFKLLRLLGRS
ncbi:MAG: glycosyltransferase [Flavobacteriales bacterium]